MPFDAATEHSLSRVVILDTRSEEGRAAIRAGMARAARFTEIQNAKGKIRTYLRNYRKAQSYRGRMEDFWPFTGSPAVWRGLVREAIAGLRRINAEIEAGLAQGRGVGGGVVR